MIRDGIGCFLTRKGYWQWRYGKLARICGPLEERFLLRLLNLIFNLGGCAMLPLSICSHQIF